MEVGDKIESGHHPIITKIRRRDEWKKKGRIREW